jgi:hypothetical protein
MRLLNINVRFDKLRIVLAIPVASGILLISAACAQAVGLQSDSIGSPDCNNLKKLTNCKSSEQYLIDIRSTADVQRNSEAEFRNEFITKATESGFSCDRLGSLIAAEPINVNHGGGLLRPDDTFQFENPGGAPASEPEPVVPPTSAEQENQDHAGDSSTESDRSTPPATTSDVQSSPESPQSNQGVNSSQTDAPVFDPKTQTIYDPKTRTIYDAPTQQNSAPPMQIHEEPMPVDNPADAYRIPRNVQPTFTQTDGGGERIQRPGMLAVPNTKVNSEFEQTTQRVKGKLPRKAPPIQRDGADPEEAQLRLLVHELEFGTLAKSISILQHLNQEYPGDPDYVRLLSMSLNLRDGDIWYSYQRKSDRPTSSVEPAQAQKPAVPVLRQNPNNAYVNDLKRESWFLINQSNRPRSQ